MTDYFVGADPEHVKFAKKIWANQDAYIAARLGRTHNGNALPRPKQIINDLKICVTRTGIYTDSAPRGYPPGIDKVARMRATVICDLLIPELRAHQNADIPHHFARSKIRVHGVPVKLNTFAVQSIMSVAKLRNMQVPTCECCGLESKYVYVECTLSVTDESNVKKRVAKRSYNLAFYCVNSAGEELRMTVDHVVPQSEGGRNILSNMQIMCQKCNNLKSSIPSDLFYKHRDVMQKAIAEDAKLMQAAA